jgi:hypothetical protein
LTNYVTALQNPLSFYLGLDVHDTLPSMNYASCISAILSGLLIRYASDPVFLVMLFIFTNLITTSLIRVSP